MILRNGSVKGEERPELSPVLASLDFRRETAGTFVAGLEGGIERPDSHRIGGLLLSYCSDQLHVSREKAGCVLLAKRPAAPEDAAGNNHKGEYQKDHMEDQKSYPVLDQPSLIQHTKRFKHKEHKKKQEPDENHEIEPPSLP